MGKINDLQTAAAFVTNGIRVVLIGLVFSVYHLS